MREEREIVKEKVFMILITKIHNPPSLLFWLRRTFPLRDNNQKREKKCRNRKRGEKLFKKAEEHTNLFWHAVYSRTSFTSSLLILTVSGSILESRNSRLSSAKSTENPMGSAGLPWPPSYCKPWHSLSKPQQDI